MRDAPGQPADRLHLLRLPQLLFEPVLLTHVLGEDQSSGTSLELDGARGNSDLDQRAVLLSVTHQVLCVANCSSILGR